MLNFPQLADVVILTYTNGPSPKQHLTLRSEIVRRAGLPLVGKNHQNEKNEGARIWVIMMLLRMTKATGVAK